MLKKLFIPFALIVALCACQGNKAQYPAPLEVSWRMEGNRMGEDNSCFKTVWTFKNVSSDSLKSDWLLYYNQFSRRAVYEENTPVKLEQVIADFYRIYPTEDYKTLAPGDSMVVNIYMRGSALKITEAPMGMYFVPCDKDGKELTPMAMAPVKKSLNNTPEALLRSSRDKYPFPSGQYLYSQDKDLALDVPLESYDIIPSVKKATPSEEMVEIKKEISISAADALKNESQYLSTLLTEKHGAIITEGGFPISLTVDEALSSNSEAYTLNITSNGIEIKGASAAGVFYGVQTLRSILDRKALPLSTQGVAIEDSPDFGYRGFMLDIARNIQTKEAIMKVMDVMAYYKMNKFHFHFNDDEAWRLEIPGLPELTEYGARRGHTLDEKEFLHAAYGSGHDANDPTSRGNGYISRSEFIDLLRYAKNLHIDVIPEIETPGHARAAVFSMKHRYDKYKDIDLAKAEEYALHDPEDTSKYTSAQAFHDNVMCVAREGVYRFLDKVVTEIKSMYDEAGATLEGIQTGGDEVPRGSWLGSPMCHALVENGTIESLADLRDYFTQRFKEILDAKGLRYWGWMEIASKKGKPNPKFMNQGFMAYCWDTVGEWGGEQIPYILANAGYDIILCNCPNLYFDFAYGKSAYEPGLYWGGWGGERLSFDLLPYDAYHSVRLGLQGATMDWDKAPYKADGTPKEMLTEKGRTHIKGLQGELWSETIKSEEMMQYYIFPKMFGLAERAWNASPSWADLTLPVMDKKAQKKYLKNEEVSRNLAEERNAAYNAALGKYLTVIGRKELPTLASLGVNFRIAPPGIEIINDSLHISNSVPGADVFYTTDGSTPSAASTRYEGPVPVSSTSLKAITIGYGKKSSVSEYIVE